MRSPLVGGTALTGQSPRLLSACGRVTAVRDEDGGRAVDLDVWIENQTGDRMAPGAATVLIRPAPPGRP